MKVTFFGAHEKLNALIIASSSISKTAVYLAAWWLATTVCALSSQAAEPSGNLNVRESDGSVCVNTGSMEFVLNLHQGIISDLSVNGKRLINGNTKPVLFAVIMESDSYDGITDYAPHKLISAENICGGLKIMSSSNEFRASGAGVLMFPAGDALDYALEMKSPAGATRLAINVSLTKRGEFRNRYIREVGVCQPLALAFRKRVVQAGDQGLRWDTRYTYQFHMHTSVFKYSEQNWWRYFYTDQDTDHSYHIWRAESKDTSGLHAFYGRCAAGWMTLYDPEGGALFAYRDISARAPKLLYADAEKGGEGVVYLYGPTQPAFNPSDPRLAAAVFGKPHQIDWIFFAGSEADIMPDRLLALTWNVESLPSDGPTKFKPVADEVEWNTATAKNNGIPLVMGGIPVPRGKVGSPDQVRLFVRGRESPFQSQALAFWPDGSVKWLQLIFPLDGDGGYKFSRGTGKGDEVAFRVTLRQGEDVPCVMHFGRDIRAGVDKSRRPLVVTNNESEVFLDAGPLRLTLATGERWLPSVILNGREMITNDNQAQAFVDFLRVQDYPSGATHPEGQLDPGPVKIDKIEVEENGPLRAVVRLEGKAMCKEPPRVILRAEIYKGRSFLRLFHSVEFMHKDPRAAFVRRMGLRLPLAIDSAQMRAAAGGRNGPVTLQSAQFLGLRQTSYVNYEAWRMASGGSGREILDSGHASRGWLDVSDARGGLTVVQRAMWQESPKELLFNLKESAFEIGLWPASAPLMDVRRYSNYPHPGQGETTTSPDEPGQPRWIEKYYREDPFVGVARTHETLLYFHGKDVLPDAIDSVAADFQSQPLVYAGWPWYASVGVTFPQTDPADGKFVRFNANLDRMADWWLFHQKAWGWYGFWDFGDVPHMFRDGYGRIFPPETLAKLLALSPGEMEKISGGEFWKLPQKKDYFTQADWAFDNGRWGWGNTEGLPNHFMSLQYLRTGRRDLFFFIEANARHVRDVDARHAGIFFGLGTRHGVQHWSDGDHEERQTTFTEQRFHYFLSGEHRAREWNRDLSDNVYLKRVCTHQAVHSARTYGLLFRWEITGDLKLGEIMKRYMSAFAQPEGIEISPTVKFPAGERVGPPGNVNDDNMFFNNFGAMHALLEYFYLTGDERLRDSLIKMADDAVTTSKQKNYNYKNLKNRAAVAFAARHVADGAPYREVLNKTFIIINRVAPININSVFQQVPVNRIHWTGPAGTLTGNNVPGTLFWLNDAAYVMGAVDAEPKLTPAQEQLLAKQNELPVQAEPRRPPESWQTEYDDPKFEKYIRDPQQIKPVDK